MCTGNVNIDADTDTHKVQRCRTQHWENSHKILACNGRGSNDNNDGFTVHGDDENDGEMRDMKVIAALCT